MDCSTTNIKSRCLLICGLMLFSVLSLLAAPVQASTSSQNDFGTSGGDLPNDLSNPSAIPNIIFSGQVSGNGQLIPASDYDYLKVNLGSNEGLAAELSFDVRDDFDISLLDSSGNYLDTSWHSNPEYVTTNGSGYFGTVYIEIMSNTHQPPIYDENYTITIWKFAYQSGQTQNDIATGGDLPNSITSSNIPNLAFSGTTTVSGQLFPGGDDYDYFSVTLAANEGLAVGLSFDAADDFDLGLWDSPQHNIVVTSYTSNNPEYVTTNGSFGTNAQTVYIEICTANHGSPVYDNNYSVTLWKFSASASNPSTQNDVGITNYDLPDSNTALQSDPNFPVPLNGAAPYYSGVNSAELDLNGDDDDWLSVTLNANEGFAFQITYPTTSTNGSITYSNDFELYIYDSNMNTIDSSILNNPEYVTTNNSMSGTGHGGTIFIHIYRYDGFGTYDLEFWTWSTSSTGGGGGSGISNGSAVPSPCTGNSAVPDILEPNDDATIATLASILPIYCTGLTADIDSAGIENEDYYEIQMISGVTYYFNLTFSHVNGDVDARLEDSSGSTLSFNNFASMSSSTDNEAGEYTATSNFTAYFVVYHYSSFGATGAVSNVYDVEISTDNPGGGQSISSIEVTMNNLTSFTIEMNGLVVGDNYQYDYYTEVDYLSNSTSIPSPVMGPYSFTATATSEVINLTSSGGDVEGLYFAEAKLYDASGTKLDEDGDEIYQEVLVTETTSSTTGEIVATNLSVGTTYTINWMAINYVTFDNLMINNSMTMGEAINSSKIDEGYDNYSATATSETWQVSWNNPISMDEHAFVAIIYVKDAVIDRDYELDGAIGIHGTLFVPQLPSAIITSYSFSNTSTTNDFSSEGLDLVTGDTYYQQFRVEDPSGADIEYSAMNTVTATAQNMSFGTFYYNTPTISGVYCLFTDLYDANYVQIVGDYACIQYIFDDDGDGVANEQDLCVNTPQGSIVDLNGCATSQKDTDNDGYNDDVDDFPYDDTQWLDSDGDGYGDNSMGNSPDAFPYDNTQWSDADGDGYGDNILGNNSDAFPFDPTQWADSDGDGYGDNANGNNPDMWPADGSQWTDTDGDGYGDNSSGTNGDAFPFDNSQWADNDGDGYGDNANGNNPDAFPNDGTQWEDADGDGYGDNINGNNADKFPQDNTQWYDSDNDGYGDNQQGNNPDAFPSDGTQWLDVDGDGFGDNQNGNNPDKFPQDNTQWQDSDLDGLGDNANGNNPDLCPGTPFGEVVDANGCSTSQTDSDQDGVSDSQDGCPNTPAGEIVNINGCSETQLDDDNDGVVNQYDLCPSTPQNAMVDSTGCANVQLDSDNDGINDALDSCPSTNPNVPVDGFGCAADQRDIDGDGVNDNLDTCPNTPLSENAANNGCSESQIDSDLDGVFNNVDQCPNTTLLDLNGDGEFDIDSVGCSPIQYDDDSDMIDNTIDQCPVTPIGEQVDSDGCSQSQLDEDNDDIWNSDDLCFDTLPGLAVDQNGCSEFQKDDDQDGLVNAEDACPNTPIGEIIDNNGCSLTQLDSDGDGVNDLDDAFPQDRNESVDTDGDGVPDRLDAYPQDVTRSEAKAEEDGTGFMFILIAIFAIGVIGALLVVRNRAPSQNNSPFAEATYQDTATEANMAEMYDSKEVPTIEQQGVQQQNQTWEENGVHWSMAPDGTLSYYDEATQSWLVYIN